MRVPPKSQLSETDICDPFITLAKASMLRADYVLFHKPNVPLRNAVIPLPPLPEQSHIITRVTVLRQRLADALVQEVA